jgi:hypothetical protein
VKQLEQIHAALKQKVKQLLPDDIAESEIFSWG